MWKQTSGMWKLRECCIHDARRNWHTHDVGFDNRHDPTMWNSMCGLLKIMWVKVFTGGWLCWCQWYSVQDLPTPIATSMLLCNSDILNPPSEEKQVSVANFTKIYFIFFLRAVSWRWKITNSFTMQVLETVLYTGGSAHHPETVHLHTCSVQCHPQIVPSIAIQVVTQTLISQLRQFNTANRNLLPLSSEFIWPFISNFSRGPLVFVSTSVV